MSNRVTLADLGTLVRVLVSVGECICPFVSFCSNIVEYERLSADMLSIVNKANTRHFQRSPDLVHRETDNLQIQSHPK